MIAPRCTSGSWLGEAHRCVHPVTPSSAPFCPACQAAIAGTGPGCDCPGCTEPAEFRPRHVLGHDQPTTDPGDHAMNPQPVLELYPRRGLLRGRRQWGWRLKATNGEVVASGEGYYNRTDAQDMADRVRLGEFRHARIVWAAS